MSSSPKIAIIGGGPGGLCLANLLQKNDIPFTLYEHDTSPNARNQGGSLDLHPQFGQLALKDAGLWDEFVKYARPESDVMKVVEQGSGKVLYDGNTIDAKVVPEEEKFDHRPEIDRTKLQNILLAPLLNTDCIKWGSKLVEIVPAPDNKWDLHFANGSTDKDFDLVVGADGAWSKVRKLITDVKPYYAGIQLIELWAADADKTHPWLSDYVGRGSCFSYAEGRAILSQRLGDGSIRSYACLRVPEDFLQTCGIDWSVPDEAGTQWVSRYFSDVGEDLYRLLLESKDKVVPRTLYMLPIGIEWDNRPGVTVLGDAAHLQTPFAGVGVNSALADARELGQIIISHLKNGQFGTLEAAIQQYEKELFPRGETFAKRTAEGLVNHFSATGGQEFADRLRSGVNITHPNESITTNVHVDES